MGDTGPPRLESHGPAIKSPDGGPPVDVGKQTAGADSIDDGGVPPVRCDPLLAADRILLPRDPPPGGSHRCAARTPAAAAQRDLADEPVLSDRPAACDPHRPDGAWARSCTPRRREGTPAGTGTPCHRSCTWSTRVLRRAPSASSTGSCTTPPPWSPPASPTGCATPEPAQEAAPAPNNTARGGDFQLATNGDIHLAIDTLGGAEPYCAMDASAGRQPSRSIVRTATSGAQDVPAPVIEQ